MQQLALLPTQCPDCDSRHVDLGFDYEPNFYVCHDCGTFFEAQNQPTEITASVMKCPHCETVDSLVLEGDKEYCSGCGLDPNNTELSSEEIAHLWKGRCEENREAKTLIREVLERGLCKPNTNLGNFIRTTCGPHCTFAFQCPQTAGNFSRCYSEEFDNGEMSKRRRKSNSTKKQRKAEKKALKKLHSRGWLFAASDGWYVRERKYVTETPNPEQAGA